MHDTEIYLAAVEQYYTSADRAYFGEGVPDFALGDLGPERVLDTGARSLLIGPPGSGKTTFLDWTALHAASTRQATPIFVSLRNFTSNMKDLLRVSVERFAPEAELLLKPSRHPTAPKLAFLFDGFDEVSPPFQPKVEMEILDLARSWPTAAIVVTGRKVPKDYSWANWSLHVIPLLTDEQVASFLGSVPGGDTLRQVLLESSQFSQLARRPAFLHTIRNAWVHGTDFRAYLMREIPRYVAWRGHTKSHLPVSVSPQLVDQLLSSVAIDLAIRGSHSIAVERLHQLASQIAPDGTPVSALANAGLATDVLESVGNDVSFTHLSLLESYAARALAAKIATPAALEPYFSSVLKGPFGTAIADHFLSLISDTELRGLRKQLSESAVAGLFERSRDALADRATAQVGASQDHPQQLARVASLVVRYADRQERARKDILVIAVHGFNTRGAWKNRLGLVLTRATDGERFLYRAWDYGEFRLGILNPLARRRRVQKFQTFFNDLVGSFADVPEVVVVAHSFGAYIVAHAARRFPEVTFDRALLLGAALPRGFDWGRSIDRCGRVLNLIGGSDLALAIARFVPGLGSAGRNGFLAVHEKLVQVAEQFSDHSDLFGNEYMRQVWLPYLRDGSVSRLRRSNKAA